MSKLSLKMNAIIKTITVSLSKKDVELLIQILSRHYDISLKEDAKPAKEITKAAETGTSVTVAPPQDDTDFPLEVVYFNGNRSFKRIRGAKAIGVIIPETNKLLYYDGSENSGTRHQALSYIKNLPYKFRWHLMSKKETVKIKKHWEQINATLRLINGLPLSNKNYMLADDNQRAGYVRYTASL